MKFTKRTILSLLLSGSIFFACEGPEGKDGGDGPSGPSGLNALIATVAEPAGTNCEHGGFRINIGSDANANSTLDASEISSTAYACNGEPGVSGDAGLTFLVKTTPEAPGENCSEGGFKIETGKDTNVNGVLDEDEITDTQYVCEEDTKVATIFEDKSGTPPLVAMAPQFNFVKAYSLISTPDQVGNFQLAGSADGAGFIKDGDGYIYVVNCEDSYAVARIKLSSSLMPVSGDYLLNSGVADFARQCSGTMWEKEIHGGSKDLFLSASEAFSFDVKGIDPRVTTPTPTADFGIDALGEFAWENAVPLPKDTYPGKTVIIGGDDDSNGSQGQVTLYYGDTEDPTALNNGKIYVLRFKQISDGVGGKVDATPGVTYSEANLDRNVEYDVEFVEVVDGKNKTAAEMETACTAINASQFMRVEDVDYQKGSDANAKNLFFAVTGLGPGTGSYNDWGTVYSLKLDAASPLTGKLKMIVSGNTNTNKNDGNLADLQSPDNICVTEHFVYIQEDPNSFTRNHPSYIYQSDLNGNNIRKVLELVVRNDLSPTGTTGNSGEFGALIDVSDKVGVPGTFLLALQPHYWTSPDFKTLDGHDITGTGTEDNQASQIVILQGLPR